MDRFQRAGQALEQLCRTMAALRAPGGCPWDRAQTLDSLKQHLIEEAYELVDAMAGDRADAHREELGDLLLQVVFQAEIAREQRGFDMADVANTINDKLVRRHPHVFGDVRADDAAGALESWERVKTSERSREKSCLDGIPRALPALLRALRTGEKAAAVGFDWPEVAGVIQKVEEECRELRAADRSRDASASRARREEMGDLLFAISNLCRHWGIDPEDALTAAVDKFQERFRHVERRLAAQNRRVAESDLDELEQLWEEAKSLAHQNRPE